MQVEELEVILNQAATDFASLDRLLRGVLDDVPQGWLEAQRSLLRNLDGCFGSGQRGAPPRIRFR